MKARFRFLPSRLHARHCSGCFNRLICHRAISPSFLLLCPALPTPLLHSFISLYLSFRVTSGGQQGVGEEEEEGEGGRRPLPGGGGGECCDAIGHRLTTPEPEANERARAPTDAAATKTPPSHCSQGTTETGWDALMLERGLISQCVLIAIFERGKSPTISS